MRREWNALAARVLLSGLASQLALSCLLLVLLLSGATAVLADSASVYAKDPNVYKQFEAPPPEPPKTCEDKLQECRSDYKCPSFVSQRTIQAFQTFCRNQYAECAKIDSSTDSSTTNKDPLEALRDLQWPRPNVPKTDSALFKPDPTKIEEAKQQYNVWWNVWYAQFVDTTGLGSMPSFYQGLKAVGLQEELALRGYPQVSPGQFCDDLRSALAEVDNGALAAALPGVGKVAGRFKWIRRKGVENLAEMIAGIGFGVGTEVALDGSAFEYYLKQRAAEPPLQSKGSSDNSTVKKSGVVSPSQEPPALTKEQRHRLYLRGEAIPSSEGF